MKGVKQYIASVRKAASDAEEMIKEAIKFMLEDYGLGGMELNCHDDCTYCVICEKDPNEFHKVTHIRLRKGYLEFKLIGSDKWIDAMFTDWRFLLDEVENVWKIDHEEE